ncbi:uncharacterized protein [Drosophila bipectinata]|uniref:uncharacterized protein isoform X2 n=1 Tax=Drosophila bipectinata TaxID=42026 RepID=UPI001C8A2D6A|nr:uncharacterized protein DDB_G0271670 isoform X2 [Drosophila bipectinata]
MTFYWWSHWFWITLILSAHFLASHVHTYPSQETAVTQSVRTTKLYQTTVSQTWSTATQSNIMDLTHRPQVARQELEELQEEVEEEQEQEQEQPQQEDQVQKQEQVETGQDEEEPDAEAEAAEELAQFEFKRSADFTADQLNNFTNFSSSTSTNGSSSSTTTKPIPISGTTTEAKATGSGSGSGQGASGSGTGVASSGSGEGSTTTPTTASTLATAKQTEVSGGTPSTATTPSAPATPSTPKIHTEWLSDELLAGVGVSPEGEKAPFTLENANKEDELRRAETEHRSRKSKVLSAEYKHINRYINFSSDTKSLLTRSASAAPSISGSGFYDGPEGDQESNISSEALAIQRTYFLDAGAISAICFTVFGICCTVGTIGIVLYRRRYLNKPQALSEPDSSVYIDDSTMRDNSDEMYSLDNDSFLNSLEAMTIQNYWTDTVKHTKL